MKKIIVILLVVFTACTAKQNVQENKPTVNLNSKIEINVLDDKNITVKINNSTGSIVQLIQPSTIHFEKLIDGSWEKLRILPCPCDAPCAPPKEMEEIGIGNSFEFTWNKKESWCGKKITKLVRETETSMVEAGTYRVRILLKNEKNETEQIYKEFTIN